MSEHKAAMARRNAIATRANPNGTHDYLVEISARSEVMNADVRIRYVPDKLILTDMTTWLTLAKADTPEALAIRMIEDLSNELVPRWIEIRLTRTGHIVTIADSQPDWNNRHMSFK
ncbi:MAG: hypothetical protein U9N14_04405 [Pseudomonadota bacterium]|nr:hypothetical protein [Pseudomonadota bacterium]